MCQEQMMAVENQDPYKAPVDVLWSKHGSKHGSGRFARELFNGRYKPGERLELSNIAATYEIEEEVLQGTFFECQSLGLLRMLTNTTVIVRAPNPKEMQEAYEIRAGLEEISGRTAAPAFKGNTGQLRYELAAMRAALEERDLDACADHDVRFHRIILRASQNDALLRVWDTLTIDLRIRATIGKVAQNLPAVVDSHQPIVEALDRGHAREAGLLLRNHVETFMQFLGKADFDSGLHRAVAKDLETAKDVQQAFFPPQNFSIPCLSSETFYKPARGIGGDYYDFLSLSGGRWGIAIGDVSGKGIGAALLMASLQASLRAQALHSHLGLTALIRDVNHLVHESSPTAFFASLFYAEYEPARRKLQYVNAGHNSPIIVRPGPQGCELFQLRSEALPIGMYAEVQFKATQFQMAEDDILVAYTDGITEAANTSGQLWGVERLESLLHSCSRMAPDEIVERILAEVSEFANGEPQRDDVTLVVMKVQAGCDI